MLGVTTQIACLDPGGLPLRFPVIWIYTLVMVVADSRWLIWLVVCHTTPHPTLLPVIYCDVGCLARSRLPGWCDLDLDVVVAPLRC